MNDAAIVQRAVLEHLIELADEQEYALDSGDLAALGEVSEQRLRLVRSAASFLPPMRAWDDELADLVSLAMDRMRVVQQATQACMAVIRRERSVVAA